MPKEKDEDRRTADLLRGHEPRIQIRRLRATIDRNDPAMAAWWERTFGEQWRERQERERHDDRSG